MELGSIRSGVMMALLNHPSLVQQVQFLQPDQLIPWLLLLMVATKTTRYCVTVLISLVSADSLWRGLMELLVSSCEPMIAFMQMLIGTLLVKAILHYTNQDLLGAILTTGIGLVADALMRYKTPVMAI